MSRESTNKALESYMRKYYGKGIKITDHTDKNLTFDVLATDRNIHITVELKERFSVYDDILIELIQTLPYFSTDKSTGSNINTKGVANSNVNTLFDSYGIQTAIGWFYKTTADRLIFVRYENKNSEQPTDIIDIDFIPFKNWVLDNCMDVDKPQLQYSDATTGTINAKIPLSKIPKSYYREVVPVNI